MKRSLILVYILTLLLPSSLSANTTQLTHHHEYISSGHETVLFVIFVAVLIWAVLYQLSTNGWLPFPPDPIILLLAILWGLLANHFKSLPRFCYIANIEPLVFLKIFLPITIFQMTFLLDTHSFFKSFWSILIIAFPGHCVTALIFFQILRPILPLEVPFQSMLIYSLVFNNTDATHVIRRLKDTGSTTKSMRIFLEGEALLKLTQYIIILAFANFKSNYMESFRMLLFDLPIQIPIGYIVGKLGCMLMRKLYNDPVLLAALLIPLPLLAGGAVSLICDSASVLCFMMGFIMSTERATSLTNETDEFLQMTFKITVHILNISNYIICGFSLTAFTLKDVESEYYIFILITFVISILARCISFAIFAPLICMLNKGLTYKKLTLCALDNIKHPSTLVMRFSRLFPPYFQDYKHLCACDLFLATSFLLSYFINAPILPKILDLIGLTKITLSRQINLDNCIQYIEEKRDRSIAILKIDRFFADVSWKLVQKVTRIKLSFQSHRTEAADEEYEELLKYKMKVNCPSCMKVLSYTPTAKEHREMIREAYMWFLNSKKVIFSRQYETGTLSKEALNYLLQAAENASLKKVPLIDVKEIIRLFGTEGLVNKFFKKILNNLYKSILEDVRPPRRPYRRVCYKIVMHPSFEPIIYILIITNVSLSIVDFIITPEDLKYICARFLLEIIAFLVFTAEFMLRVFSYSFISVYEDGVKTFFSHMWNRIDFFVLVIMFVGLVISGANCAALFTRHHPSFAQILKMFQMLRLLRLARMLKPFLPAMIRYFDWRIDQNIAFAYDVGKGFVTALIEVLELLPYIVDHADIRQEIQQKMEEDRLEVTKLLGISQKERPWIAITVKTKQAIRLILNSIKDSINTLKLSGWVDDFEFKMLMASVDERKKYLSTIKSVKPSSPADILKEVAWMGNEENLVEYLLKYVESKHYNPGDVVCKKGELAEGIFVVLTGLLNLTYIPEEEILDRLNKNGMLPIIDFAPPSGDFSREINDYVVSGHSVGKLCFLNRRPMDCTVTSSTHSFVYFLHTSILTQALELSSNPITGFRSRLWRIIGINLSISILSDTPTYKSLSRDKIKLALERCFVQDLSNFKVFKVCELIEDIVLIQGILIDVQTKEYFVAPCYIPRTVEQFKITADQEQLCETQILIIPTKNVDPYVVMLKEEQVSEMISSLHLERWYEQYKKRSTKKAGFNIELESDPISRTASTSELTACKSSDLNIDNASSRKSL